MTGRPKPPGTRDGGTEDLFAPGRQLVFGFEHRPSHAADDFIVTKDNRLAVEHVRRYPDWPGPLTLLTGPAKSGKSHLARIWAERAGAVSVTPETAAAEAASGASPLLVEDVDSAPFAETDLFHLLNRAMRENLPLLMTAARPVSAWPYRTADLMSRARLAAHFALDGAEDDTRLSQILVKLFADRQLSVDGKLISYLVTRMERSAEEAVALVALIDELALAAGKPVGRAIAAEALALRGAVKSGQDEAETEPGDDE